MQFGEQLCKTPEEFKAWSQNLGHEQVLTTFLSYGTVSVSRQAEIIQGIGKSVIADTQDIDFTAKVIQAMKQIQAGVGTGQQM